MAGLYHGCISLDSRQRKREKAQGKREGRKEKGGENTVAAGDVEDDRWRGAGDARRGWHGAERAGIHPVSSAFRRQRHAEDLSRGRTLASGRCLGGGGGCGFSAKDSAAGRRACDLGRSAHSVG